MLVCCEDVASDNVTHHINSVNGCREHCEIPMCKECAQHFFEKEPFHPPVSLANDMMMYYAQI